MPGDGALNLVAQTSLIVVVVASVIAWVGSLKSSTWLSDIQGKAKGVRPFDAERRDDIEVSRSKLCYITIDLR